MIDLYKSDAKAIIQMEQLLFFIYIYEYFFNVLEIVNTIRPKATKIFKIYK